MTEENDLSGLDFAVDMMRKPSLEQALAQVAALRKELAGAKADEKMFKDEDLKWQLIRELGAEIKDLKIKLEEKEKAISYLHQRAIISSQAAALLRSQLELSENSLTAAEQRNSEMLDILGTINCLGIVRLMDEGLQRRIKTIVHQLQREKIAAALKPTESEVFKDEVCSKCLGTGTTSTITGMPWTTCEYCKGTGIEKTGEANE